MRKQDRAVCSLCLCVPRRLLLLQSNLPDRLVRRRLRLFLRQQEYFNKSRLVSSCRAWLFARFD